MMHHHSSSWPGLIRPSTSCLRRAHKDDVDARVKPGHDDTRATRTSSSTSRSALISLPAAGVSFLLFAVPAYADLKLCNRMSYVVEVAIGIDDKAAPPTRGWVRLDSPAC